MAGEPGFVSDDWNYTIDKFTPGGVGTVFASSGFNFPRSLAFTDDAGVPLPMANLPEPASLWLLGLAGVVVIRRVKRRSRSH